MRLAQDTVPVRVQLGGSWAPVDTTLRRDGDWFSPVASAVPVRFSPGGTDVISQTQTSSGEWVSESWTRGALPVPTVEGDTATYAEVMAGVDLKLVATRTGMASIYVVKSAEAAKGSGLAQLQVAVDGAELTAPDPGRVKAEATDGSSLIAAQPLWWDSSGGGTYREPGEEAPPAPVAHTMTPDQLTMDVGASVVAEETRSTDAVQYPIFVDPDWSPGVPAAWYTDAAYPDASYLTAGASDVLRVGVYQQYHSDMFFQFGIGSMLGKHVLSAVLNTTQLAVMSCPLTGAIETHLYGLWDPGFTWNQEQYWNNAGIGGWSIAMQSWVGAQGCDAPAIPVGWTVTAGVQQRLNEGASGVELALIPTNSWSPSRRWFSRSATLIITYNSIPNAPAAPVFTSPSRACGTAAAPVSVTNAGPLTVQATGTDPDPENVSVFFTAIAVTNPSVGLWQRQTPLAAQGAQSAVIPAGTFADGDYAWDARTIDSTGDSSNWFGRCYFRVDSAKPAVPSVTTTTSSFTVGSAVNVSLSGTADVAGYTYWVSPVPVTSPAPAVPVDGTVSTAAALPDCNGRVTASVRWACGNGSTAVTVSVAPTDSLSTLWVSAYDRAGNQSAATGLALYQSTGTPADSANLDAGHEWQTTGMDSPLPLTIPDANPWIGASAVSLTLPGTTWASTDTVIAPVSSAVVKGGTLSSPTDAITSSSAPVNATNSFTTSVWVKFPALPGRDEPIATQSGTGRGSMQLAETADGKYSFCLTGAPAADDNGRPVSSCATGGSVVVGSWQLVTGIWDASNQQLRLLIGNSISPVAVTGHVVGSGDWSANGPLRLAPAPSTVGFHGYVANPTVLPGVIDHNQMAWLATLHLPFSQ